MASRAQSFNKILLTTSNTAENNILLQEISGQLYINNHLVVTSANIGSLSNITTLESDVTTLESDVTTLESDVTTLQSDVQALQPIFNISTRDTEANILASTPTNPTDEVTVTYGTDTGDFYIYDGSAWYVYKDDGFSNTYSLSFDGTDDYVNVGSVDSTLSNTVFSYSVWFKLDHTSQTIHSIIAQDNNYTASNTTRGFFLVFDNRSSTNSNRISASVYGAGNVVYKDLRFNELDTPDSNWHHFVFTCDIPNDTYQAYFDGSAISPSFSQNGSGGAPSSMYQNNLDLYIGSRQYTGRPFKGNIDEVALFNTALNSSQVTSIYNNGAPAGISSLNPVHWYRMGDNESGTGTTITDQGSGGNNGTLTNGPTFSTDVPEFTNTYSLSFDGTNDYVDLGSNFKSTFQSDFTIALWVKVNTFTHGKALIAADSGSNYDHRFSIFQRIDGGNKIGSFYTAAGAGTSSLVTTSTVDWTSWNHIAFSYAQNGGSVDVKVYVNGSLDNSTSKEGVTMADFSASGETAKTLFLGARHGPNGSAQANSSVYLDEVAFFNSALSGAQVASLVDTSGPNPVPDNISSLNPVAWYRMGDNDSGTGTTITDQGSGGNNGTLTNGPTFSTTIPS